MNHTLNITDTEQWLISTTLKERYGHVVEFDLGEAELRLSKADRELTICPVIHWQVEQCHFVVFKTGDRRYRCQFFYRLYQQYSTGRHEYDDLTECLVDLLQVQADYAAQERGDIPIKKRRG